MIRRLQTFPGSPKTSLTDWSLIMGRGGGHRTGVRGACEVLPLRKGGAEKAVAMMKGGRAQQVFR